MAYQTILFEKRDGVGYITLNRPDKLNAISREMLADLRDVLSAIEKDQGVRVVILTGAGRAFSAGFDISAGRDVTVHPHTHCDLGWTSFPRCAMTMADGRSRAVLREAR